MSVILALVQGVTGLAFLGYGISCLATPALVAEFERFGLARFRVLTGWLEVAGGVGLLAGLPWPGLGAAAAAGLSALMALGVWARVRVGDPFLAMLPAICFLCVNAALALFLLL
jgi:hypothetical protein